jgi:hypothetical protein
MRHDFMALAARRAQHIDIEAITIHARAEFQRAERTRLADDADEWLDIRGRCEAQVSRIAAAQDLFDVQWTGRTVWLVFLTGHY